ncbi:pentatricopeptide repeat-containing protein At5g67570, chloroplastic [Amaranthus tricolor]|uniref:pentatricopeptide repeat-containing protein At5g67570, chloroplastic n=1 Tax=Amaranthus tricolor TaxID=29722 RepID=UPI0025829DA6|nr:pentatricopeptide repeat-containing protein At5g67570, chloroplastic [Amaranthus tricolor]
METSTTASALPTCNSFDPLTDQIKQRILKKGVLPTPKIIHTLRKKHQQKSLRKFKRLQSESSNEPFTQSQKDALSHEFYFQNISQEYRAFSKTINSNSNHSNLVGKPWEPLEKEKLREIGSGYETKEKNFTGKLNYEQLKELGLLFEERKVESLSSFLDDDVELEDGILMDESPGDLTFCRRISDGEAIKILVNRLSVREITRKDWKFTRMMKQSELKFTEFQLLKILGGLGDQGCWKQAMEVVEWVYSRKEHRHYKSRFVYTKLLAVLGKARKPDLALQVFEKMRLDCHIYPDMAAYRSIAVTLGQAGMVRELMSIIESLKEKPSKYIKNMRSKNWDPTLQPDIVVYNSVLNACVPSNQWKGVSWVFEQLRKSGLRANSATYGLAMEVMLKSSKFDLVHQLFQKMAKSGKSPNALTYKVLVRTFWKEGKVEDAVRVVREMEQRGIKGSACVYYELACCLCNKGRWQEAMIEVERLKKLRLSKPLAVTFTGMIMSSMDGGHIEDCISIFENMRDHCSPNIGTITAMLKVYARNDMFLEVKELFENVKAGNTTFLGVDGTPLVPDVYTYRAVLEASASAHQWEYFEYVYKEMCFSGYQLDQRKHATLLVAASKAGKWHLLEHAFETTLEAGEIPYSMLFTEMVCHAVVRDDYVKAVNIVNSMAYAPFRLDEKDWTDLFEKNKDRISDEHLKKFSTALCESNLPNESTVSKLLNALHSICGLMPNEFENVDINGRDGLGIVGHPEPANDEFVLDKVSAGEPTDGKRSVDEFKAFCPQYESNEEDRAGSCSKSSGFVDVGSDGRGMLSEVFLHVDLHCRDDFDEMLLPDAQYSDVSDSDEPDLPSADEILQSWKKTRRKNGTISFSV